MDELDKLGEQLQLALSSIVNSLPTEAQTIREMSSFLDYNSSNSQRILKAINHKGGGSYVLCLVPGVSAINEFLLKSRPHVDEHDYKRGLEVAQKFAKTIKERYSSHAELKRLLSRNNAIQITEPVKTDLDNRKDFFRSAKQLLGASVDSLFSGHILLENKDDNKFLHEIVMISKKAVQRKKNSAPCVLFYTHPHPENFNKPELINKKSKVNRDEFNIGIVDEHSTDNLIDSYVSFSPTNLGLAFDDLKEGQPFDATFMFSNPDEIQNPLAKETLCSSTFISVKSPTKKLTMVVFLERKIDMCSSVNIGCYHSSEKVEDKSLRDSDAWTEHLPGAPELKLVNLDSPIRNTNIPEQVIELSDYMFNYAELDRKNFVCYLMEVEYPIWSSTYRIYFDHC